MDNTKTLEDYINEDYPGFVKQLLIQEMGVSPLQATVLYQEYMDRDEMALINPDFEELVIEIDWQSIYLSRHLEHMLQYRASHRDDLTSLLQAYYQAPAGTLISQLPGFNQLEVFIQNHITDLVSSNLEFFKRVNETYKQLFSEEALADQKATFSDLIDLALKHDLIEEKEQFLRTYFEQLQREDVQKPSDKEHTIDITI